MAVVGIPSRVQAEVVAEFSQTAVTEEPCCNVATTTEQIEAYFLVRSILRQSVAPTRVLMRDDGSSCCVLLDGDPGKLICRFHFDETARRITIYTGKGGVVKPAADMSDLHQYSQLLRSAAKRYDRDFPPAQCAPQREVLA